MSLSLTGNTAVTLHYCYCWINWSFWAEGQKCECDCVFFLTVVKFDRGGFQLSFSPPGRLVFAPLPGSPGCWRTAPSSTAGC